MKTGDTEHAGAAAESFVRACPAERWQDSEAAGRSVGRSTGEATQNHGRPEDPEGVRRRSRDAEKGRRAGAAPLVTVVIPCYNQAHFLGEAIESVLAQSHPNLEVIVVDDGSPDNTSEVAAHYPRVRCVRQENQGLSAARNSGLAVSEGEYVVFLDADDRLLPEALEAGLECFEAHPECAFVHGDYRFIAVDGSFAGRSRQHVVGEDHYATLLQGNYITMPATVMYRRAVFETVGGFDTFLGACEDYDMYLRVARRFPVCGHEKVVAEYRGHGANMSHNAALMLSTSVSVLRSQRKYAKEDKHHRKAYETGMGLSRYWYGAPLIDEVRARIRERDWKRVVRGVLVLLRYYPLGLALLNKRRMENTKRRMKRRRLAQRLQARKQELEVCERRLKESKSSQESESASAKERQEVQRLRRRTRRLKRRVQDLDRQARTGRNGKVRKLLKRLGRIRAKAVSYRISGFRNRIKPSMRRLRNEVRLRIRRLRSLVRRKLVRRVKPRVRRFRRLVELVRLLGFTQSIRFVARRLRGASIIALKVPGVRTPLFCRTFGSDPWVLRGVFWAQHYEVTLQEPPQLIIDGGANVGYASIYFASKYPDAQIIAIEPDPENCALFRRNCAAYANVELIQGALWTSSTDLVIENPTDESWGFRVVEAPSSTNCSFKGFTVADILARSGNQHIDLLKLDIESSEEYLFSSDYSNWIGRVKNLVIELHGQRSRNVVLDAIKDCDFYVFQDGQHIVFEKKSAQDSLS